MALHDVACQDGLPTCVAHSLGRVVAGRLGYKYNAHIPSLKMMEIMVSMSLMTTWNPAGLHLQHKRALLHANILREKECAEARIAELELAVAPGATHGHTWQYLESTASHRSSKPQFCQENGRHCSAKEAA